MEIKSVNILIVEDHPMISEAYVELIRLIIKKTKIVFLKASNCSTSLSIINQSKKTNIPIDIALVDIRIPEYREKNLFSGTDIAMILRELYPNCKILMLTMHTEALILFNVFKKINPEGFISKNDVDFKLFSDAFSRILLSENFYSPSIKNILQKKIKETFKWDEYDTQIIILLDKGILTKDMPNYINLSLSSIEKRKAIIKYQLLDKKSSDKELLERCKVLKLI
jgi:DNA-binding NarL/FixJ family response regulator